MNISSWLCCTAVMAVLAGCKTTPAPSVAAGDKPAATAASGQSGPASQTSQDWISSVNTDPMDGTKETVLSTRGSDTGGSLVVRFKGNKLDVYVVTDQVVDHERGSVRVKFDDSAPVHQTWGRSTDYTGIFSPDPYGLLMKLQQTKKFLIEYQPFQRVPETLSFNVEGLAPLLPAEEMAVQGKMRGESEAAYAELKKRILPFVQKCKEPIEGLGAMQWCWTDPTGTMEMEEGHTATRDVALEEAMRDAKWGIAFHGWWNDVSKHRPAKN